MHFRVQPAHNRSIIPLTDQHVGALSGTRASGLLPMIVVTTYVRDSMYGEASLLDWPWRFVRPRTAVDRSNTSPWTMVLKQEESTTSFTNPPVSLSKFRTSGFANSVVPAYDRVTSAGSVDHMITQGLSQCGRALRTFVHGMNSDSDGGLVYDGVLAHCRRSTGEFNHRYGQPSVQPTRALSLAAVYRDHAVKGVNDGLLVGVMPRQSMPKVFFTDTAAEYWRGDARAPGTSTWFPRPTCPRTPTFGVTCTRAPSTIPWECFRLPIAMILVPTARIISMWWISPLSRASLKCFASGWLKVSNRR